MKKTIEHRLVLWFIDTRSAQLQIKISAYESFSLIITVKHKAVAGSQDHNGSNNLKAKCFKDTLCNF